MISFWDSLHFDPAVKTIELSEKLNHYDAYLSEDEEKEITRECAILMVNDALKNEVEQQKQ